jgi:uncharacterized protein YdgA (DUF945 family)
VKKGFVYILLVLAVIVLVSPGIVGRLAERSMDENLDWAATEANEVTITSQGFDRGWFSSEGQHRVELRGGKLPVLIIDTRIDHGLVPVASMAREQGSLAPGLGRAVSTLRLEFEDASTVDLPGTIYSEVGLGGELTSNLVLEAGSFADGNETAYWGSVDVQVSMSPSTNVVAFGGDIEELVLVSPGNEISVGTISFDGERQQTQFGIPVGDAMFSVESITMPSDWGTDTLGPVMISSSASQDGGLFSGHSTIKLDDLPFGELGRANVHVGASIENVDGEALGNISRAVDQLGAYATGDEMMLALEEDLQRLLAAGFELHFDQVDIVMQPGTVSAKLDLEVAATDIDRFVWTSAIMALDATLDVSVPAELYDYAVTIGLLTVNGAPMPIPLPGGN